MLSYGKRIHLLVCACVIASGFCLTAGAHPTYFFFALYIRMQRGTYTDTQTDTHIHTNDHIYGMCVIHVCVAMHLCACMCVCVYVCVCVCVSGWSTQKGYLLVWPGSDRGTSRKWPFQATSCLLLVVHRSCDRGAMSRQDQTLADIQWNALLIHP